MVLRSKVELDFCQGIALVKPDTKRCMLLQKGAQLNRSISVTFAVCFTHACDEFTA